MTIHREGDKRTNIGEGVESALVVRLEDGDHAATLCAQVCQEICCHRLAVYHQVSQMERFGRLFIGGEHLSNPVGQMQITAMGGRKQWMSLIVMQQRQGAAAQAFARVPDESSGNQGLGVNSFAMSIDVKMGR
jgi:hypothetical protein